MSSTTITDYQILADEHFTLDANGKDTRDLSFTVPNDLHIGNALPRRAIFSFNLRPLTQIDLRIRFHGLNVLDTSYSESKIKVVQEVFSIRRALHIGEDFGQGSIGVNAFDEPVRVRCSVSDGRARLSDIVVWYQIDR